jgi:hypothetical protein
MWYRHRPKSQLQITRECVHHRQPRQEGDEEEDGEEQPSVHISLSLPISLMISCSHMGTLTSICSKTGTVCSMVGKPAVKNATNAVRPVFERAM